MGRRPNAILAEFFERGAKLQDNSNRYEHTCKRCGELFPKGRVDSLTAHLLRKCPNATQQDREWVFQQLQQTPDRPPKTNNKPFDVPQDESTPSALLANYQHQSALDTLAEVSRHHLDYSVQHRPNEANAETHGQSLERLLTEQALIAHLRDFADTSSNPLAINQANNHADSSFDREPAQQVSPTTDPNLSATSGFLNSGLVQTASAANQQLEASQADHGTVLDPHLDNMSGPVQMQPVVNGGNHLLHAPWRQANVHFGHEEPADFSAPPQSHGLTFGMPHKAAQKKVRGHFDASRRKEVASVRKTGACLRCRMLKKPCSGESPCSTCRKVESARVWKGTCIRTRIADEFTLWSSKLFHSKAAIEVAAACHDLEQVTLLGRIEARFLATSKLCVSFAGKRCTQELDPSLSRNAHGDLGDSDTVVVLTEGDTMIDKLELYAKRTVDAFTLAETTPFVKATLEQAHLLAKAEEAEHSSKADGINESPTARSCYNLQQRLVENVIELWVLTRLLALPAKYPLQLRYDPHKAPNQSADLEMDTDTSNDTEEISPSSSTYRLIYAQLYAAIESRCSRLSKTVMGELEHRLLRRQQASHFNTFIAAVILLKCVECMTALYTSFDSTDASISTPGDADGHHSKDNATGEAPTTNGSQHFTNNPTSWPLDTPASKLAQQGPRFANLLAMLLRIRGLPPKTVQTNDGALAVMQHFPRINHTPFALEMDEQTNAATAWLDPLKLSVNELLAKRDGELPAGREGVEAWEMRFVSKLLLPERSG